jgi:hypothetical protein
MKRPPRFLMLWPKVTVLVLGAATYCSAQWTQIGSFVTLSVDTASVGIGTSTPSAKLDIRGSLTLDSGDSPALYTGSAGGELNRYLQIINSPLTPSASGLKAGGLLVSDTYAFANPGKNDLVVKGSIGIGTNVTSSKLTLESQDAATVRGFEPFVTFIDTNAAGPFGISHRIQSAHGDLNFFQGPYLTSSRFGEQAARQTFAPRMVIKDGGNVGIGTDNPNHQLSLGRGPKWTSNGWGGSLELQNASAIGWQSNAAGRRFGIGHTDGGLYFFHTAGDPATSGAPAVYDLTINDAGDVTVGGTTRTKILTITGGSDLAEPFKMPGDIPQGAVLIIDDQHPGQLTLSRRPYDTRVGGVVSGANGLNPGISMTREDTNDGSQNVALSGRVYVLADAAYGAIRPGDLLTTSSTPGYAMKASNRRRSQGAVLGKAMTGLSQGRGMVLALVALQ